MDYLIPRLHSYNMAIYRPYDHMEKAKDPKHVYKKLHSPNTFATM